MLISEMTVPGAYRVDPEPLSDRRGHFFESVRASALLAGSGWEFAVRQVNFSVSRRNTLRGIHGTKVPPGQAKFVTCVRGSALDIAKQAESEGVKSLRESGLWKVRQGVTSLEEVLAVTNA